MATWAKISMVLLLVVQAYTSCVALNAGPKSRWVTRHLSRPDDLETRTHRHLIEKPTVDSSQKTLSNGWRTTLIHPHYKSEAENVTTLEKIHRDVETSKERARFLDRRSRRATYKHNKGRKMLQQDFVSSVQGTPGGYSMDISIGTPPQTFSALADTGSDLVWLQSSDCNPCFESTTNYDASVSSSYQPLGCGDVCDTLGSNKLSCDPNCQYTYLYGDQSSTVGDFSLETVTLQDVAGGSTSIPNFQFGRGLQNNGTFTGTSGIVGLARGPISFPSQIAPSLTSNKFSYCLLSRYDPDTERSPIYFGEAAVPTNSTISETPLLKPYDPSVIPYYYVSLVDISVNDERLSIPSSAFEIDRLTGNGGVIFDSGTTYTILTSAAYQKVREAFKSSLDSVYTPVDTSEYTGLEVCYDISGLSTVSIPSVTFNFDGANWDLPFDNIVITFSIQGAGDLYICLAILESEGLNIFGNVQQQDFQVLYDEDNSRIGWVEADCKSNANDVCYSL
ncbi:hypothetical protein R1sor_004914 [Riccia sorocarpa]|uniref:Peptidase A1 domain-containing protein n=1 Tax=Riccia sorocarpa TaxID=122646 RepID=A0ABD3HI03_9MARC